MNPDYSILTSLMNPATGFDYTDGTNNQLPPGLLIKYFNEIESTTVVDEGGNAINIRFTPILIGTGDYHIGAGQAWNKGSDAYLTVFPELNLDFDGEPRPFVPSPSDIGADELQAATPAQLTALLNAQDVSPSTLGTPSTDDQTVSVEEVIIARKDLAKKRKILKKAIKKLAKVKKNQAKQITAAENLEGAINDLKTAEGDLQILVADFESLVDPKSKNKELKRAKKELKKALKVLLTAEKALANANLKG